MENQVQTRGTRLRTENSLASLSVRVSRPEAQLPSGSGVRAKWNHKQQTAAPRGIGGLASADLQVFHPLGSRCDKAFSILLANVCEALTVLPEPTGFKAERSDDPGRGCTQ